jgi:hypothetical protein
MASGDQLPDEYSEQDEGAGTSKRSPNAPESVEVAPKPVVLVLGLNESELIAAGQLPELVRRRLDRMVGRHRTLSFSESIGEGYAGHRFDRTTPDVPLHGITRRFAKSERDGRRRTSPCRPELRLDRKPKPTNELGEEHRASCCGQSTNGDGDSRDLSQSESNDSKRNREKRK